MERLHQFLHMMGTERRATRSTLSAYEADLRNFYKFLEDQKVECVTFQDIQDYLFTQKHFSSSTVERRLSSLRQFYRFLMEKEKIKETPLAYVNAKDYKPKPPPVVGQEDVKRLLKGAQAWDGPEGKRLVALLQILYETDVSVSALVSLPFPLVLDESFSPTVHEVLRDYLLVRNSFLQAQSASPWLFPSLSQTGHLTRQRFGQLLRALAIKVGLNPLHLSLATIRRGLRDVNLSYTQ